MERDELRAVQEPLKARYREAPDAAQITLHARGQLGEGISCSIDTGRAIAEAGLHPLTGGDGTLLCSGDMLLEALAACAGVTLRAVATSLGLEVRGGTVSVEGDLDFRGTLSVDKQAPVGFTDIRVRFDLDTDASAEEIATLTKLTERYCVVLQSLARTPELSLEAAATTSNSPQDKTARRRCPSAAPLAPPALYSAAYTAVS
jgi:uncharacterized OsmC-like protein